MGLGWSVHKGLIMLCYVVQFLFSKDMIEGSAVQAELFKDWCAIGFPLDIFLGRCTVFGDFVHVILLLNKKRKICT